jgi:hypothetical protein
VIKTGRKNRKRRKWYGIDNKTKFMRKTVENEEENC